MSGITEETAPAIDAWATELLQGLDAHFPLHPYRRPSVADFALYGPLCAHVGRDSASRDRTASHGHLLGWIQPIQNPSGTPVDFAADDIIPEHLRPILTHEFKEQFPILQNTVANLAQWSTIPRSGWRRRRGLARVSRGSSRYPGGNARRFRSPLRRKPEGSPVRVCLTR